MVRPLVLLLAAFVTPAAAQTLTRYVESPGQPNTIALGYPVPLPRESLTPVDGFRSYASLLARWQQLDLASPDLDLRIVGSTFNGRDIHAALLGDADARTPDGAREAAVVINAATHAREWQAPEVSTAILELLVAQAQDRNMVRYVLDHVATVVIPVQNVDGFLQTQRYPTEVLVGRDPTSASWPRDGRMRRKNMRGADDVLGTLGDHLRGVDLNRNHPRYFGNGSPFPDNLTWFGPGPHSEPENVALEAAVALAESAAGGGRRLRLGQDIHSFGQVFFTGNAGSDLLNNWQSRLVAAMSANHRVASSGRFYIEVLDPPGFGTGTAGEWFAGLGVPGWTLELEPAQGGQEYGGFGANHDGFVLPDAQVRRVRDAWAQTQLLALYMVAGPPHLASVRVDDAATGEPRVAGQWVGGPQRRAWMQQRDAALLSGRSYRVTFGFSKPIRWNSGGAPRDYPGIVAEELPRLAFFSATGSVPAQPGGTRWIADPQRTRYDYDSLEAVIALQGAQAGFITAEVDAIDVSFMLLDADPSTVADWSADGWTGYEDEEGQPADGGADRNTRLRLADAAAARVRVRMPVPSLRSGADARVVFERLEHGPPLTLGLRHAGLGTSVGTVDFPDGDAVAWGQGERGFRSLRVRVNGDADAWPILLQAEIRAGDAELENAAVLLTGEAPR